MATRRATDDSPDRRPSSAAERLYELWGEIHDLEAALDLLHWDQETHMPAGGEAGRAAAVGTVTAMRHRLLTAPELTDLLGECAATATPGSHLAAQVRTARREVDRATRVPERLERELARAQSAGVAAWRRARAEDDVRLFAAELAELVTLKRQEAAAVRPEGPAYDALLDRFEPGATTARLEPLFEELAGALTPLVRAVAEQGRPVDEAVVRGSFPAAGQIAFGRLAAEAIGFDFNAGRLDPAAHPFCVGFHPGDVRLTWRVREDDLRPGILGILHEAGHGLYEQGLPRAWTRTPLGADAGVGIHESQSRLWENHVGRSRGFWRWALPRLHETVPTAGEADLERLWPALHTVEPSLIRVEADEVTYGLHIVARFELERALFEGDLEVADLPEAWAERYRALLGIRPERDRDGLLQDIHWAEGMFGYFPTYALGSMAAAQLHAAACRDLGDLEESFAAGRFTPLLDWLRRHVHRHGARYTTDELLEQATGKRLATDDLVAYLSETVAAVYGIG